ncbi:MAG: hypothetical protein JO236_15070 [Mycobacterium sp.]|uniref:hypothetical protein n=1 Tax=Mycobacterium sp. TaxID=1785 RepID=UPI001EBD3F51|nr:hypothetical protein [Mycobacterium sp.]MBW0018851.1 hypothetical protein [Mycobacterium sp.]
MPDELLPHLFGPQSYSSWWLVWAVLLLVALTVWHASVFVWTLPAHRLRRLPLVRRLHAQLIRNRFARRVQHIADQYRAGRMSAPQACAAISRTLRSFLHQATGAPAQYLHVDDLAGNHLAAAASLLTRLGDAQFNAEARADVADVNIEAQELIRSWT